MKLYLKSGFGCIQGESDKVANACCSAGGQEFGWEGRLTHGWWFGHGLVEADRLDLEIFL